MSDTRIKYLIDNKEIMKEWDWEKNNELELYPNKLSYGSNKKAWWICPKGHNYNATISKKTQDKPTNCPICSNKKILKGYNDLEFVCPNVAKEWNYLQNGSLRPSDVIYSTTKKVWWKCSICDYEWESEIRNRTKDKKTGCPQCASKIHGENKRKQNLSTKGGIENEKLINEWDYEKNYPLTPCDVTNGSNDVVWWICNKGHSFKQRISNRTYKNYNCPYCSNQKLLIGFNDLATTNPEILKEWDYEKNGDLKPENVMQGSKKKVWWKCIYGHSYSASLNHRTSSNATKCPICISGRQTSFAEQAVYYYVKKIFPDAQNRVKKIFNTNFELDIYIPSISTAIEYDGQVWHKNQIERERKKYKVCHENNIRLIRLREMEYILGSDIADYVISYKDLYMHKNLELAIHDLIKYLTVCLIVSIDFDINIARDEIEISNRINDVKNSSIQDTHPEIAKEWHPTLNNDLKPSNFSAGSTRKVYWLCPNCNNEYKAAIYHRTSGTACPICAISRSKEMKSKSVVMIDINTNEVVEKFVSISDAGRKTNNSIGNICSVLKGKRKHTKGYIWKYESDYYKS